MNLEHLLIEARLGEQDRHRELADLHAARCRAPRSTSTRLRLRERLADVALRFGTARARAAAGPLVIRTAGWSDKAGLARLAALSERPEPSGPLLLAEIDERLVAALPPGGEAITDPFVDTEGVVVLLRLRAEQLRRVA